jgi:hypothetical protein
VTVTQLETNRTETTITCSTTRNSAHPT